MQVELSPAPRSFCSGRHSPLTGQGWAVRCRCRSLPAGDRCAQPTPATHQPSPENSSDFTVLGAGVSQVWPAELTWSSRRAGRVADVRNPIQVCKDRPPTALRPPHACSRCSPSGVMGAPRPSSCCSTSTGLLLLLIMALLLLVLLLLILRLLLQLQVLLLLSLSLLLLLLCWSGYFRLAGLRNQTSSHPRI